MSIIPPTVEGIAEAARNFLRDFPIFFEVDLGTVNVSTVRLPHPNIEGATLQVYVSAQPGPYSSNEDLTMTAVPSTDWTVDERNGLLKFNTVAYQGKRCFVAGYHYEWFLNSDLMFHASTMVSEHVFQREINSLSEMPPVELEILAMGTVMKSLWTLVTEFSTDIDINSPEGMFIPARQRFQQVWQMLQYWESQYEDRSRSLNVGLHNIDIFNLRRVSRMTNRFVPMYKAREYDDHNPPERYYPPIPSGMTTADGNTETGSDIRTVEEVGRESMDLGFGGWQTGGTSGG